MKYILMILILSFVVSTVSFAQQNESFSFPENTKTEDYIPNKIVFKLKTTVNSTPEKSIQGISREQDSKAPMQYFEATQNTSEKNANEQMKNNFSLVYTIELQQGEDIEKLINDLRQRPDVEYAEPLYTHQSMKHIPSNTFFTPNDTDLTSQYYLTNINAFNAWDLQQGNASILIGITDDNFELTHSDLAGRFVAGYDVADGDADVTGGTGAHGTLVAGCSSANTNNNLGMAGVGYNCRFMPVKIAKNTSQTSIDYGYEGVLYAAQNGCKVINMSWGRTGKSSQFELDYLRAIVETYDVVLVAAGGQGTGTETYWYPASYSEIVLGVGGTTATDDKWSFSDFNDKIGICAPGNSVYTTNTGNSYLSVDGTSFSAPLVAGAAALLRVQYPALKASQIIALLKANSKVVTANTNYPGKMGKGLLDINAALLQTKNQYVSLQKVWSSQASAAVNTNLICSITNQLNPLTNLTLTLSTSSPHITIVKNTSIIGNMATLANTNNQSDPFIISVSGSMPANTAVTFQINLQDGGSFSDIEYFTILLNPTADYVNLTANQLIFSAGSIGNVTLYDNNSASKLGLRYKNYTLLNDAGLIIALNSTKVSNTAKIDRNTVSQSFTNINTIKYSGNSTAVYQEVNTKFEDVTNNANRVGVEVLEKAYTWKDNPNDKFVIVEYQIRNITTNIIDNMYVGLFGDWNIQNGVTNIAGWDNANQMGYVYQNATGGLYGGICILTSHANINYYAIDNDGVGGSIKIDDVFSNAEKFQAVSSGIVRTSTSGGGNDVSHAIGAKLQDFLVGQSKTIAFAFIAGDNLADIQASAIAAKNKFKEVKTSKIPTISTQTICTGSDIIVYPGNGTNFKFYNSLPTTNPIATGNSLKINNLTANATYYVTGSDSLYESSYATLQINVYKTDFSMTKNTLNLSAGDTLVGFQSTNNGAVEWKWDFGNGKTSVIANPTTVFKTAGTYNIRLITKNTAGCADTLTKQLTVTGILPTTIGMDPLNIAITGINQSINQSIYLFPNPAQEEFSISNPELKNLEIEIFDGDGRNIFSTKPVNSAKISINIKKWNPGTYIVKINSGDGFQIEKLIIQR